MNQKEVKEKKEKEEEEWSIGKMRDNVEIC